MLDVDKLFKIHPYIFKIKDEYYAFGTGVCKKYTDEYENKKDINEKYLAYKSALQNHKISFDEAWKSYYSINSIAEDAKNSSEHIHLEELFAELNFSDKEKNELQNQLELFVSFFNKNGLVINYDRK